MTGEMNDAALEVIEQALDSGDPLVQIAALDALGGVPLQLRTQFAQRFLTHELLALRISAARALVPARASLGERRQAQFDAALQEYFAAQTFNSDRGEGPFNLGSVLLEQGALASAEEMYLRAVEREPAFTASYVNLSDLYRQTGRERDAQELLRNAIDIVPEDPGLSLSLGLSLVRTGEIDAAIAMIEQSVSLGADDPYYHYVLGVALNSGGRAEEGIGVLEAAHERFPAYRDILFGLAAMLRDSGDFTRAAEYARRLVDIAPADATARALLQELETIQ
jgi:tetratricopeptide (TPR) repeat protein